MRVVDPKLLGPGDAKAHAALARYSITRVGASKDDFAAAYGALAAEFEPRGELERREVIERWLEVDERVLGTLRHRYHLLLARDADGSFAGARDCHTVVDERAGVVVVYLAHVLVAPEHRRLGLASLMRAAPLTLGRDALGRDGDILLAAEMEPAVRDAPDTLVRLVAYGRAGFRVVAPEALPYCQPDFRHPDVIGSAPRPLPLLAVVRRHGDESPTLPRRLGEAYVRHLYAVFSTHCREEHMAAPRAHALERLAAHEEVPLLPLPHTVDDETALQPLWREAVLPHHLPGIA